MARELNIVGGGLAGLSLATALSAKGIPVTVWEAGDLPRHRVCGEFICGVRPETLRNLGVEEDLGDALVHRRARWQGPQGEELYKGDLPREALGISRFVLDLRLAERIERNGGRVRLKERWRGDSEEEGVVLASGRSAERTDWMGFKMHIQGNLPSDLTLFLGNNGYVGLSPVEGGFWNLCGLFRKRAEVRAGKEQILGAYAEASGIEAVSELLAQSTIRPDSSVGVAGVSFALQPVCFGEVRIGDAWGVIPPFTGNGMSIALESAECALRPLSRWAEGMGEWNEVCRTIAADHRKRFRRRFQIANGIHPWILRPSRRPWLKLLSKSGLLPFKTLFSMTH